MIQFKIPRFTRDVELKKLRENSLPRDLFCESGFVPEDYGVKLDTWKKNSEI